MMVSRLYRALSLPALAIVVASGFVAVLVSKGLAVEREAGRGATSDPAFFSFYSPDLEGFTGVGHSLDDCISKARLGMREHVTLAAS
jgi:hypothetical protein